MRQLVRQSLLAQLLGVYLLFVIVVLAAGFAVNVVIEQRLRDDVQASDQALARQVAVDTSIKLQNAQDELSNLCHMDAVLSNSPEQMKSTFEAFMAARTDVDRVYWLDQYGVLTLAVPSLPQDGSQIGQPFSPPMLVDQARLSSDPVAEVGVADLSAFTPGVILAKSVDDPNMLEMPGADQANRKLLGIVAMTVKLTDLSEPLKQVRQEQAAHNRQIDISIIDSRGELIATPDQSHLMQTVLDELPGADQALHGLATTQLAPGPDGNNWLFSSVPVAGTGWAVVVQRPASEALDVVDRFHIWLLSAVFLFALGGLVFWVVLVGRVIRPLHALAQHHRALPVAGDPPNSGPGMLAQRDDEVGGLARSLTRLQHDVTTQLGELRTLLETSNAVVNSLDPRAVGGTIIHEVRRLVDVQAAAVLVPDEQGTLRVLVSEGRDAYYNDAVSIHRDELEFPAARALHDGRPVQIIADGVASFPPISYADGFRAVLAIPIISRHVGDVVLLVHRTLPQSFTEHELDLLLTFANYATLAWEHAVLYERTDERLRQIALDNQRLYQEAVAEKQTLAAIMRSMSDGLLLTSLEGTVLYANPGASALTRRPITELEGSHISAVHDALRTLAESADAYDRGRASAESGDASSWLIETSRDGHALAIKLRLFDVIDENGQAVGRGLLLRDVTSEHEVDRFKTTLLGAVGHELRTPLAAIKGHASTLLAEDVEWPVDDQRHFLRTISTEADRLAQLVTNLLDLSRMEAGLLHMRRQPASIASLVDSASRRLTTTIPTLRIEVPSDLPLVEVDSARIEVVLVNLLTNAALYGEGLVTVTAQRDAASVVVSVTNDGPIIEPTALPHIFERFYRSPRASAHHSAGTGLGLAICKAFMEAHGGSISATSDARGTTIACRFPLNPAPSTFGNDAPLAAPSSVGGGA